LGRIIQSVSREPSIVNKLAAEFFGTTALFACGTALATAKFPVGTEFLGPILIGLTVAGLIYALGRISGAHFNPAVTFAMAISKRQKWGEAVGYIFVQFLAGFAGTAWRIAAPDATEARQLAGFPRVTSISTLSATFILTGVFVAGIWVISFRAKNTTQAGLLVGGSLSLLLLIASGIPQVSLNPLSAVSNANLETALASGFGGLVAGRACQMMFGPEPYEELV
jgi:aquaporin Z